ncbi:MAG: TonB-dependent receptor [Treponema sp.]|jgi:outer membrane receptor for ferrienterochelin and colicins|nr:TonB-dependent receptor [Treponema sp.]
MNRRFFLGILLVSTIFVTINKLNAADAEGAEAAGAAEKGGGEKNPVLVVTGAKVEQDINETVEAVEVISGEEIARMGAKTVAEVMQNIPGVVIYDHPQSTVMMQGFEGAYVKVLIDGMEVTGDVGGATPVSMIPVADIERIEIVRGASSVLYGSDAMGGVINIITKKPEPDKITASTRQEFASNLRYYGEGFAGYDNQYFGLSAGGSFDWDQGRIVKKQNNMGDNVNIYDVPGIRIGSVRGKGVWHHGGGDLELYGSWSDTLQQVSADIDNGYDFMYTKLEGGLNGEYRFSDHAMLDGFFSYRQLDYHADRINSTFKTTTPYADSLFRDLEGELRFSWDPVISHALLAGVNIKREALESDSFEGEKQAVMLSAFAQDTWNLGGADRFRVTPGLRLDIRPPNSSEEDTIVKVSPKLSLRYDPVETLILRLAYGMGFKAPTLKQNYWVFFHPAPYNFLLLGNPNLKSESSHGINASVDYKITGGLTAAAGAYFNYIFDLIEDYIADEDPGARANASGAMQNFIYTRSYHNVGTALTTGADLSLRWDGRRFDAFAAYSLTVAKGYDENRGRYIDLTSRVPHQIHLNAAYTVPVLETTVRLSANWNAPQRISYDDDTWTPDFLMTSLRLSRFFFKERLEVYGGIRNLLNNLHFMEGSDGESQKDYYGLRDGIIFFVGGAFKW